ncbi:hypothetical protein BGZ61DRAFT_366486 [Ilyonectria robusta]|uniref:uncharacterized protein n=1 Tax=Ilyonectria robusta TaxID=1079257 RepID=UPI001E8E7ED8|nr:uncharacterized protein BGZ61DRAFT_366486 [Ilyonectria robusta]KAH8665300.1 hypothetical protein BGZ61DRAFT_366486 [Ilyonectria robusta]
MSDNTRVLSWVQSLPEHVEYIPLPSHEPCKKRKPATAPSYQLASPPASLNDDENKMTSTPKKRRLEGSSVLLDPDATPRPGAGARMRSVAGSSASISQSASETSSVSGASSPKKQMMSLRLSETGVEWLALNENTVPEVARTLFNTMGEVGRGHDILPDVLRPTITEKLKARNMDHRRWRHCFKPADEGDALPGRIPSIEEVEKVLMKATECENFKHEEASWNSQVHLRLLEGIFEEPLGGQCDDFNAVSCTSARPHREFKPISSTTKMIDICVYASLDRNEELRAAMTEFSNITPTMAVNHTDFETIQHRPLVLSIETKKPGVEWEKAQLQTGVWHAAQWAFLRWGVGQKLLRQRLEQGLDAPTTDEEQEEFKGEKLAALSKLGFIPGVIVQGNGWHLVLSTYEDGKTKLWTDWVFGTTKGLLDIYAVVAGIRELTAWARDVYLPWFGTYILD